MNEAHEKFKNERRVAKKLLKLRLKGFVFHDSAKSGTYIRTKKRRFEK